jgi:superfamily I DNA/RNA helicase
MNSEKYSHKQLQTTPFLSNKQLRAMLNNMLNNLRDSGVMHDNIFIVCFNLIARFKLAGDGTNPAAGGLGDTTLVNELLEILCATRGAWESVGAWFIKNTGGALKFNKDTRWLLEKVKGMPFTVGDLNLLTHPLNSEQYPAFNNKQLNNKQLQGMLLSDASLAKLETANTNAKPSNEDSASLIKPVAEACLSTFERIANAAQKKLDESNTPSSESFANHNTLNNPRATENLDKISQSTSKGYETLVKEPAIARVLVRNQQDGEQIPYYICREYSISSIPNLKLASRNAPVARLASLDIGEEFTLPDGSVVDVLERTRLQPTKTEKGWDSTDSVIESESFGPVTIKSLREILAEVTDVGGTEDLIAQLLAEETHKPNLIEGVRRAVIDKMGFRDQPILDKYQDEIFRLPLNKRLLILGPPGTGKTTTLIRRLGQKLDEEYLEEDEKKRVVDAAHSQGTVHANSWLMFTPTELLKQYLKEAFAREGVPASDLRIKTWKDYQSELARNTFGVLRTSSRGGFILKDKLLSMNNATYERPIDWFDDFYEWQRQAFLDELNDAATRLQEANSQKVKNFGVLLQDRLSQAPSISMAGLLSSLTDEIGEIQSLVNALKESSDNKITAALNLQLNRNRLLLDELAHLIDGLQQAQSIDADAQDDSDADDEEDPTAPRTGRVAALNAYKQAVRAQARATVSKRAINKTSRNGKIIEWLGERGLAKSDCTDVGKSLLVQASARRFVNPIKRYIDTLPNRYIAFRRERQLANTWYLKDGFEARDIHPLELDIVLLAILRAAGELIRRPNVRKNIESPAWSSLQPILRLYRTQILVDEATDFSPIQLASMAALADPKIRSFFACGDFNQRLTTWGARSADELKWVFSDFDIKEVTVSYRQSKRLNDLAQAMVRATGGTEQPASLPKHLNDNKDFAPALLENAVNIEAIVVWLAKRICEIDEFVGQLPSTAIFVNAEDEVAPVAEALNRALAEHNIQVIACQKGQAVGQENNVRVFSIEHIKGLEFEAVFFVGVDQLATLYPMLFDKYLYVGTTRAATYLGMICQGVLPASIENLRLHFGSNWQQDNHI